LSHLRSTVKNIYRINRQTHSDMRLITCFLADKLHFLREGTGSQPGFVSARSASTTTTTRPNSRPHVQSVTINRIASRVRHYETFCRRRIRAVHHTLTPFSPIPAKSNPVTPSTITTLCALGFAGPGKEAAQYLDPTLAVRVPG
jgi:hypothetical protein